MILLIIILCLYTFLLAMMQLMTIRSDRKWQSLRHKFGWFTIQDKLEIALRDFVIAYDNQEPEQLLGAYLQAGDTIQALEAGEK